MEIIEDIKRIEQRLNLATPHELASMKLELSSIYARMSEMLMNILKKKPLMWNELRRGLKSDTSAERAWEATEEGLQQMELAQWLKVSEKMTSAINSMLRIYEAEAKNEH